MLRALLVELAWLCLLVSSQIAGGVELPGKKANSRFEGVSALRLSLGSAAGEHKFTDVAGYAGVIKGFKSSDPNPIPFKAIVAASLVDRLRLVVTPSPQGKLRKIAFGLTFDDRRDVTQTVSRSKSGVVTFVAPLCERGATGPEASALLDGDDGAAQGVCQR